MSAFGVLGPPTGPRGGLAGRMSFPQVSLASQPMVRTVGPGPGPGSTGVLWGVRVKQTRSLTARCTSQVRTGQELEGGSAAKPSWEAVIDGWRIRPIKMRDVKAACDIQSEAFHEPAAFALLDNIARTNFAAEVLSAMRAKLKAPPDVFMCLVAESATDPSQGVLGVVEIGIQDDREVRKIMELGEYGYAYTSSMAVRSDMRRKGIASAMLKAVERVTVQRFDTDFVVLHVYQANEPAIELYMARGWEKVLEDPGWFKTIGRKPRLLLKKQLD